MQISATGAVLVLAISLGLAGCGSTARSSTVEALAEGKKLYEQSCAACHGIEGEGQPDWKRPNADGVYPAPPHDSTGHTWHHADGLLLEIIAQGGAMPDSQMIGFAETMTEEEMRLTLDYIKTFWGDREREFQEQMTKQYKEFGQ